MPLTEYLIKFSISLALVYIFYRFVLRPLTFYQWNRFYLLCYSLFALFLPFINISPWIKERGILESGLVSGIPAMGDYAGEAIIPGPLSAGNWMVAIFVAGMALCLARMVIQWLSFRKIRRESVLLQADGNIRLYETDSSSGAFSFGNSVYVNPKLHSEEELKRVIQHEIVHVKQQHTIDLVIGELLCMVNWFNPFAWLVRAAIRQNLEFIADNQVLLKGHDKKEYQYLLLKAVGAPQYSIATHFNLPDLKKRITMMNKMKSARPHLARFLFALPLLAIILLAFRSEKEAANAEKPISMNANQARDTVPEPITVVGYPTSSSSLHISNYKVNSMGYILSIADNNGECVVVIKDKKGKIIKALSLTDWDKDRARNESTYGKLPPPPAPPAPPAVPAAPAPPAFQAKPVTIVEGHKIIPEHQEQGEPVRIEEVSIDEVSEVPMYVVDGEISTAIRAKSISAEEIEAVTVHKGERSKASNSSDGTTKDIVEIRTKPRLFIVDGVEQPATFNIKTAIKPEDMESVNVLKGKAATDKYGEKGKNGVLEIRTKK